MINIINTENKLTVIIINHNNISNLQKVISWFKQGNYDFCKFFIINNLQNDPNDEYNILLKDLNYNIVDILNSQDNIFEKIHVEGKVPYYMYLTSNILPDEISFNILFRNSIYFLKENKNIKYLQLSKNDILEGSDFKIVNIESTSNIKRILLKPYTVNLLKSKELIIRKDKDEIKKNSVWNYKINSHKKLKQKDINMNVMLYNRYILGKRFLCRAKNNNFVLFFKSISSCLDDKGNISDLKVTSNKIYLHWRSGPYKKTIINCLPGYTKIQGFNDKNFSFIGIREEIIKEKSISAILNNKPIKHIHKKSLSFVVCAYNIDNEKIDLFLKSNYGVFSKFPGLEVIVVVNPMSNFISHYEFVRIVRYPEDQKIFSIGKTINYGIRHTFDDIDRVVIKTDIDILFSSSLLKYILSTVIYNSGMICLCSHINSYKIDIENLQTWRKQKKDTEGKGACFALIRGDWFRLNGYDERLFGWGGDDTEMYLRSKKYIKTIKVNAVYPLYHINHSIRINDNNFIFNSQNNMNMCSKLDWENNNWGIVNINIPKHRIIENYKILSNSKKFKILGNYKSYINNISSNDYTHIEQKVKCFKNFNKKVSIIIITYNRKDLLEIHLQALCNQTYDKRLMEIIIADDGSSDHTKELLKKHNYPFSIKYVWQKDMGYRLSKIRNEAIKLATNDIIIISDVDMIPVSNYVCNHMKWHHINKNCAVIGHRRYVDSSNIILNNIKNDPDYLFKVPNTLHKRLNIKEDWRLERYRSSNMLKTHREPWLHLCGGNVSMHKSVFIQVGLFDEDFQSWGGEDQEFSYRLYKNGIYMIPDLEATGLHVEHSVNIEDQKQKQKQARILINKKKIEFDNIPVFKQPLVTIFIPVFNRYKYLSQCIRSALNQTFKDFEILICDDASTDQSFSIIQNYMKQFNKPGQRPIIRCIKRNINGGISTVWNMCFRYAKGKYILQLDGDDWLDKTTLSEMIKYFDYDVSMVHGGYIKSSEDGKNINGKCISHFSKRELLTLGNCVSPPRMFNSKYYYMTEGCNESYKNAVDYDLVSKICINGRVISLKKYLYYYRQHLLQTTKKDKSILRDNHQKVINHCKNINKLYTKYYEIME